MERAVGSRNSQPLEPASAGSIAETEARSNAGSPTENHVSVQLAPAASRERPETVPHSDAPVVLRNRADLEHPEKFASGGSVVAPEHNAPLPRAPASPPEAAHLVRKKGHVSSRRPSSRRCRSHCRNTGTFVA